MIVVEFLVFNDKKVIKSVNTDSFNHLLQSDPNISIKNNQLFHSGFSVDYKIDMGKVGDSGDIFFHLRFSCNNINQIQDFTSLLRAVKAVVYITNKTPQILFDGISLYYSELAYPKISEIENLMRKLITKFMMINVGIEWTKDRVPEDVKKSINPDNNDATYLHNVDFIQLSNFLFSENFPVHKENLIQKLKKAKNAKDINIEEIKSLIPISNWDKYFFDKVSIPKEVLSKQWEELYKLRVKVAHNKDFSKQDLESVIQISGNLKDVLFKAIDNLDSINLSETQRAELTEGVARNFNQLFGEFISKFMELTKVIGRLADDKIESTQPGLLPKFRTFQSDVIALHKAKLIDRMTFLLLSRILGTRNEIVHNSTHLTQEEILDGIEDVKKLIIQLDGYR